MSCGPRLRTGPVPYARAPAPRVAPALPRGGIILRESEVADRLGPAVGSDAHAKEDCGEGGRRSRDKPRAAVQHADHGEAYSETQHIREGAVCRLFHHFCLNSKQ